MSIVKHSTSLAAALTLLGSITFAGTEGMPSMPLIKAKRIYTVTAQDDLQAQQGFGDQEPIVKMMNLMMVEGSGLQGMDMSKGQTVAATEAPQRRDSPTTAPASGSYEAELKGSPSTKVGVNSVEFTVIDSKTKKPARGLKLKSQVSMTSMDMGTETPAVKEKSPGLYEVKAGFAMKGPWAVKIVFPDSSDKVFYFEAASKK